ncbi:hypothetical protein NNO07_21890 [Pseudomonas resinovorans]|uniref:Uncharacterized protein n=1 Tax=Metapseudomonas resinovorans TaxID=53412 RepID=A0ABT4YA87_METRE|nr:hypothetical protein [Pseudomonas resinovorans]MDA8485729.1 hypothetical protein [Pseudomonas resinovorans]
MDDQAYDEQNKADFERNTEILSEGIIKISSDKSLKPTIAELSRITSIHRNTIRQRGWPLQRLEAIKDNRRIEALAHKVKAEKKQDPVSILAQRLEKSRLEVLYWFNQFQDAESSFHSMEKRCKSLIESRDFYMGLANERQVKIRELEMENSKARRALEMVINSNSENKI